MTAARKALSRHEMLERLSEDSGFEFRIPLSQFALAQRQVNRDYLNETYFIIPDNDGEAHRTIEILQCIKAPHLRVSKQDWGATLEKEGLDPVALAAELKLKGIRRIAVFEIPGPEVEARLRDQELEVLVIDHHDYDGLKRAHPQSSMEQLLKAIHWPESRTDRALAVNDRSYIPGLKALGLTVDEIRAIRIYDLLAQGKRPSELQEKFQNAREMLPNLQTRLTREGLVIHVLQGTGEMENYLKQELAIQSLDGRVNAFTLERQKIGFSGSPAIVDRLYEFDYTTWGYRSGSFVRYAGGDPGASRYFGFKPKEPPEGEFELLPAWVVQRVWELVGV